MTAAAFERSLAELAGQRFRKVHRSSPEYELNVLRRIAQRIELTSGGCWLWTGTLSPKGYGRIGAFGMKAAAAHRVVYELLVGAIPVGLELDHLCRRRGCVNPVHLDPVTHAENVRRGELSKIFGDRTHCANGHEFSAANTIVRSDGGGRACRTCQRAATARWRARNLETVRCANREAKRRIADTLGHPQRFPGRVHPRFVSEVAA